ncbi:hypothetical protein CYMTET_22999, partial [Cymbomonas tetramitiformis]
MPKFKATSRAVTKILALEGKAQAVPEGNDQAADKVVGKDKIETPINNDSSLAATDFTSKEFRGRQFSITAVPKICEVLYQFEDLFDRKAEQVVQVRAKNLAQASTLCPEHWDLWIPTKRTPKPLAKLVEILDHCDPPDEFIPHSQEVAQSIQNCLLPIPLFETLSKTALTRHALTHLCK